MNPSEIPDLRIGPICAACGVSRTETYADEICPECCAAVRSNELVGCVEYLESHGGRLTQSMCRTKWPDGTVTDFAWQYDAEGIGVLGAKTAIGAILGHMSASR